MATDYSRYFDSNFGLSFSTLAGSLLFVGFLWLFYPPGFHALIRRMFGIEYSSSDNTLENSAKLNLYGINVELKEKKGWCFNIPRACLWFTTSTVIGMTLLVFIDGIILNVIYLSSNQKCPENGDMDCYSTSNKNKYFFCNSSDILIPESLGPVVCYRWFKKGMSTLEILEQIGLCTGIFQMFNLMVEFYLRLLFYVFELDNKESTNRCECRCPATLCAGVLLLIPLIALIALPIFRISVTGLTLAVLGGTVCIVVLMQIFVVALKRNAVRIAVEELSRNTVPHNSSEMTVFTVQK